MNAAIEGNLAFPPAELAHMRAAYGRDGFIQIDALTTADDIATLRSLLGPLLAAQAGAHARGGDPGVAAEGVKRAGYAEVVNALGRAPALRQTRAYQRCRSLARSLLGVPVGDIFDHAIYKPPHYEIAAPWHQDEIYNRAPMRQRAVNFWIPLQAASVENGCLRFSPGSHRGGLLPHHPAAQAAPSGEVQLELDVVDEALAVAAQVGVGGATAHHPLTAHCAGPNRTDAARTVWVLHFGAFGKWRYRLHPRAVMAKVRSIAGR